MKRSRWALLCLVSAFGLVAAACTPPATGGGGTTNLLPVPVVSANPTSGDIPLVVEFSSAGSSDPDGTISTYSWDFGDGSPLATTPDATHTYTAAGTFTAKLTVKDNANATASKTVTISTTDFNSPPEAVIVASTTSGKAPLAVDFTGSTSTDVDGTVVGYEWDFGDGSATSSAADPSHTFSAPGSHVVTLTVTDNEGAQHTSSTTITVIANLTPTAAASATPTSGKLPLAVSFSSAGSVDPDGAIASYAWTFGDGGTSASSNPLHTYTVAGTYTATLTVTDDNGATDSTTVGVQVNANIAPTAVANSNVTAGQAPLTINFTSAGSSDPDGGITGYSWSFGDTNGSSSANPTYTYSTPGSYTAVLTVSDAEGATATSSIAIQVDAIPNNAPTAVAAATPTSIRQGLAVAFSSAGSADSDGTITAYHWDFGDGGQANTANPTHAYGVAGTYTATLTITDNAGGTATATTELITVSPNLAPTAVAAGAPGGGKAPLFVSFSAAGSSDSDGTVTGYNWDFGDGTPNKTTATATHTYSAAGTYTATLTVTDDFGATDTTTVTTIVTPNVAPTAVINATPQSGARPLVVAFSSVGSVDSDGSIVSYAWDFGDGGISTSANPSHTYPVGNYTATLTVKDDNGVNSAPVTVAISVYVDDDADGVQPPADCNDNNAAVYPGAADPLDAAGLDSNCDGVDGVLADTVFVAAAGGADTGSCGALGSPCASLASGVSRAAATSKSVVQVANGTYPAGFTLTNAITVRGGYAAGFASRTGTTTVNGSVTANSTTSGASLVDLTINGAGGANATGVLAQSSVLSLLRVAVDSGTPTGAGSSAYGVRAITNSNVSVVDSTVTSKPGVAGAAGSGSPAAAAAGCNGGNGSNASGPSSPGSGPGSCGGSGVAASGNGGTGGSYSGSGSSGSNGGGGAAGGNGGCGSLFGCGTDAGNGSPGAAGTGGGAGAAGTNVATSAGALWVGISGGNGGNGALGGGGGGGGGGKSASASGGGGGAGGGGGSVGIGSSGVGSAGGGSFGTYAHNSSLTVTNSTVNAVAGGAGGAGTAGGAGGAGGTGGGGGSKSCCSAGSGGSGGAGGAGGGGGGAGGGAGGPSISVFHTGTGTLTVSGGTQTRTTGGAGGAGGAGGSSTNAGATGSTGATGLVLRIWNNGTTTA